MSDASKTTPGEKPADASAPTELRELVRLSMPLIAGYAGSQLMGFVDTAMVGRLGPAALGGVGIGNGIYFAITVIGMGCVMGLDPIIAQAFGAGEQARARRALWQGIRVAVVMSLPLMALIALSTLALVPMGIEAETAAETRSFLFGRLPNIVPLLAFTAARSYLQAASFTRPIVVAMIVANIANVIGNTLLIYGDTGLVKLGLPAVGLPALGVFGSGLSSSISSALSFVIVARGVAAIKAPKAPPNPEEARELLKKIIRLGLPVGAQLLAEVGAFTMISVLAGRMGKEPAAGYQVAIALASFTFTVTLGIASATTVRVGRAVGRGDTPAARRAGFLGMWVGAAFMVVSAAAFFAAPELLARALSNKPEIIAAAAPLIQIAAVFQISDGLQVVAAGALRGAGDTRSLHRANLIGHYAIGLPLAAVLGFGTDLGASGLFWGLSVGLTAVAVVLILRFYRISKGTLARV